MIRTRTALAKLIVYVIWAFATSVLLAIVLSLVGTLAGLGPIDEDTRRCWPVRQRWA